VTSLVPFGVCFLAVPSQWHSDPFEVVWKKGERREGGMEVEGREAGGREERIMGVPSIEADEAAASSLSE